MAVATGNRGLPGEDVYVQVPATYGAYLRLLSARGGKSTLRYIYHDGSLTIVSPGETHEDWKQRLSWVIEVMLVELEIPFKARGSLTLKRGVPERKGAEGDLCYYFQNFDRIKGKKIVMERDPQPDLQVEVVVSHPADDSLVVYSAFGVPEVWVCDGTSIEFLHLQPDGRYLKGDSSAGIPGLMPADLEPWVFGEFENDLLQRKAVQVWVANALAPRLRPRNGEDRPR